MLVRLCLKSFKLGFRSTWTKNCQMYKLGKAGNQRSNHQHSLGHRGSKGIKKKIYFCFTDYMKSFVCITKNCGKFLKRIWESIPIYWWEYQTTLPVSWETCMQVKKQQLEPYVEQLTGSKLGKEYDKAAYCHPVYLTYMQSTSWEMPGWMNHELNSSLPG